MSRPEGTIALHEVTQIPMVSTPVIIPSSAKNVPIVLWLTEKEKNRAKITDGSVCYAGTIQK